MTRKRDTSASGQDRLLDTTITRRRFLEIGAGTTATVVFPGLLGCGNNGSSGTDPIPPLRQPDLLESIDGLLDAVLTVRFDTFTVYRRDEEGNPIEPGALRNPVYWANDATNGTIPGPTLQIHPGDTIQLELINDLPRHETIGENPVPPGMREPPEDINIPHHLFTTNYHTHGFHVSPIGNSDNVLLKITPKDDMPPDWEGYTNPELPFENGRFAYQFDVPDFHPPGTHWYHPHKHGSTRDQVEFGMAGALIIADEEDSDLDALHEAGKDFIFIFQELRKEAVFLNVGVTSPDTHYFTINGQERPIIEIGEGEVQRWRFLNAAVSIDGYINLELRGLDLHQIAMDGLYFPEPHTVEHLVLAPGNRADFLLKGEVAGATYQVIDLGHNREPGVAQDRDERVIATVKVVPYNGDDPFPTLPPVPDYLEDVEKDEHTVCRDLRFDVIDNDPREFLIDLKPYSPTRTDQKLALNAVEEWTVRNYSNGDHPFHKHVNPFQVIAYNGRPVPPRWQDVVNVPGKLSARMDTGKTDLEFGSVTFLTKIRTFTGKTVLHCHILFHEDRGMMQLIEITDGDSNADPCEARLASATAVK